MRERLNFRRRPFCVQLCIETLCKRATSVAHLTNFSFEFFYKIFTEDASQRLLYHGAKKSKMTKNSNQGGPALNRCIFCLFCCFSHMRVYIVTFSFLLHLLDLIIVAPRIVNFTTGPPSVYVGDDLIAKCCASGNPQPIIAINGKKVPTSYTQTNGVYSGCAEMRFSTSSVAAGTNMKTTCSVTLEPNLNCTTANKDGTKRVPPGVIENCNAALKNRSLESLTNTISGKSSTQWMPVLWMSECLSWTL